MSETTFVPAIAAPVEERTSFLRRAALWTFAGLTIGAVASVVSLLTIVPTILRGGTLLTLGVVYGSFLLSQTVVRRMVYGQAPIAGFVLGTALQGVALGFLLLITLVIGGVGEGLKVIGYALALTIAATVAMCAYVSMEKREFSLLRAGLSMLFIPMLLLMGLQLVFPIEGTLGILVSVLFVAVSVGAMLWKLNEILYVMPATMSVQAGYEISLGLIVLFWNILSLLNRLRRN